MPSSTLYLKAHAKVNLLLNLLGQRPDGFHEVRFVMQTLALADHLRITVTGPGLHLAFTCSNPELATDDNLVVKAYHRFYTMTGLPPKALSVHLEKRIPVAAGLGGGSADAAMMLIALNRLHEGAVSPSGLTRLAGELGSDVPFFLVGGTGLATGHGEIITPLPTLPEWAVLLVKPRHLGISTPWAYQQVREAKRYEIVDFAPWEAFFQNPTREGLVPLLQNDFEAVLFSHYPQLRWARERLLDMGCPGALLSGSGPTLFALVENTGLTHDRIENVFSPQDWLTIFTRFSSPVKAMVSTF